MSLSFIVGIAFSRRDDDISTVLVVAGISTCGSSIFPAILPYLFAVAVCNYSGGRLANLAMGVEFGHLVRFGVPPRKDQRTSGLTNLFVRISGQTRSLTLESSHFVYQNFVFDF